MLYVRDQSASEVFTLGGVANALQGLYRYAEAEVYYRKGLKAFKGMPRVLSKISILEHNFGICLWIQGRYDEALEIQRRHNLLPTSLCERLLDREKFNEGNAMLEEALATHRETLKLFRATIGDWHPKTDTLKIFESDNAFLNERARSTYMLGCVCQDSGDIDNGRLFIEKAEDMRKQFIGAANWSPASGISDFDRLINCWSR
ncbi:hypothetical protein B0T24DRAFT_594134 [Lasiosphaeria ovina]|uniref:Tetratricopeptide repeat protein n=1 Tax=Lasiosphaeria ovina TaxID=92902 RepID=A0AAE0N8J0_9PEZI|nr:hypothetical protein B0T24DRAFT_594134 [Lasiosphaeria ovina]